MKRPTSMLLIAGLLTASLEGAADTVNLIEVDGSAPHDTHQRHPWAHSSSVEHGHGHTDSDHGAPHGGNHAAHGSGTGSHGSGTGNHGSGNSDDDAPHTHVCHCGLHAPPLPAAYPASLQVRQFARPQFRHGAYSFLPSPPLLKPPIA